MSVALPIFPGPALLAWHPRLAPVLCGLLLILLGFWTHLLYRRLRTRVSPHKATLLILPKIVVLLLLALALFDPAWSTQQNLTADTRVLALLDTSSSMDVKDDGTATRLERARRQLAHITDQLGRRVHVRVMEFDTRLHEPGKGSADPVRGTDLAGCLRAVAQQADLSTSDAVLLLTDGGDERFANPALPNAPLYVVGYGTDPETWRDVALLDVAYPKTVEKDVDFEITVDVLRRRLAADPPKATCRVTLEHELQGQWQKVDERSVDLTYDRARVRFKTKAADTGLQSYRVSAEGGPNELSLLNNRREFAIEARSKALHVLFFTRELSTELKMIRNELASDPGITFTALFRTIGERFTVQGERLAGDEDLADGFPEKPEALDLFDCILVGSFSSVTWRKAQMDALVGFVQRGGSVIFLGGEESFGRGNYATTPLAGLIPWVISVDEPELQRGTFPVSIPRAAGGHPILAGMDECFTAARGMTVESMNSAGPIKPGATVLLQTSIGDRVAPLVAVQTYGKGHVLAIASNTMWKWALASLDTKKAYGLFWRQAVRNLSGETEGGRLLLIKWDKDAYRPGEQAVAEIRIAGDAPDRELRFTASLTSAGKTQPVPVEPLPGRARVYGVKLPFAERGNYAFSLTVNRQQAQLDSYEKVFPVFPTVGEGARLEMNQPFLKELAEKSSGVYVPEADADTLVQALTQRSLQKTVISETSLIYSGPFFALLVLAVLVWEWVTRRMLNLF